MKVLLLPPVWIINEADKENIIRVFANCDLIFNQRVSEGYSIDFLRPSVIKENFPDKAISWPNMYFDGYFAGIRYVYDQIGKLEGPLGDYHFQWILDGWLNGLDPKSVALSAETDFADGNPDPAMLSINRLAFREQTLDCSISDYIRNRFRQEKLFFSMNHPNNNVLVEMLRRLFVKADLPSFSDKDLPSFPYTLNEVSIPSFGSFKRKYWPLFEDTELVKGKEVLLCSDKIDIIGKKSYSWLELTEAYYALYTWARGIGRMNTFN